MTEGGFRYDVGKFRCTVFSDGQLVSQDAEIQENFDLNCLFIDTGERKILIDTGCGEVFQADTTGNLVKNMEGAGIKSGDIDTVIFTHGHIDHAGGSFSLNGRPVFPNAKYVASRKDWEYWAAGPGDNELQNMFFGPARKNLLPIRGKFNLVEDNDEVLPGIKLRVAPGHTPGNMVIDITSKGARLFCIGDVIHSQKEFVQPEELLLFDIIPEQAMATRSKIFADVAESGVMVFACHFPFPGIGHITRKKGVLTWEPIKS